MNAYAMPAVLVALAAGCGTAVNYPAEGGPRYAGGPAGVPQQAAGGIPEQLRIVTFNTHFARRVDRVAALLGATASLAGADIIALQEVDARATRRIASALGMSYVYYPGAVHPVTGRDFGNAVLARWPIVDDRKVLLPHHGRLRDTQRTATAATVAIGGDTVRFYSVHLSHMGELGPGARREQARAVIADAAPFRRVVVAGDLNGVRVAEEFVACRFLWPTRDSPPTMQVFAWDHILLRGVEPAGEPSTGVVADDPDASDHFPVWAVVRWTAQMERGGKPGAGGPGGVDPPGACAAY
jgi:endonuclease/exonuclease/phosphatase family metal-dependent hydrolase